MTDTEASEPVGRESPLPGFKDRYAGLCIFGVFEIIGGVVSALLIPATLFLMLSPSVPTATTTGWTRRWLALMCAWLALAAVGLVTLGIGSMRAARWAWALNLILSWFAVAGSLVLGAPTLGHILVTAESAGAGVAAAFVFSEDQAAMVVQMQRPPMNEVVAQISVYPSKPFAPSTARRAQSCASLPTSARRNSSCIHPTAA